MRFERHTGSYHGCTGLLIQSAGILVSNRLVNSNDAGARLKTRFRERRKDGAPGNWRRAVRQARIRLLSFGEYNMRRVLRGLALRHRKSQRGQVNAAKKRLTLT